MYHRLYLHVVWTTRERAPIIDAPIARFLDDFLPAVARQERARVLALGVVRTHVHLLLRVHPTTSLPRLLQRLKGGSAHLVPRGADSRTELRWSKGYSAHSVSAKALDAVRQYVSTQASHHPGEAIEGFEGGR